MQRPTEREIAMFHQALVDYVFSAAQSKDEDSLKWSIRSMILGAIMLDGNDAQREALTSQRADRVGEAEESLKRAVLELLTQRLDVEARVLRLLPIDLVLHLSLQAAMKAAGPLGMFGAGDLEASMLRFDGESAE